jgi:hypothetical protein
MNQHSYISRQGGNGNYRRVIMGAITSGWPLVGIAILATLVGLYLISKIAPRGVVLLIAIALWWLGWRSKTLSNDMVTLVSMCGFAGVMAGIFDLFGDRKKVKKNAEDVPPPVPREKRQD